MALRTILPTYFTPPEPEPADGELLARFARTGDQEAFAALVARHGPRVLGVCRDVLRDDHAAEDAFQAVFMVLAAKAESVARPEALGSWLHGVAVRVALKARARRGRAAGGEPVEAAVTPDPAARLAADELRVVVGEELDRLPAPERDLLVLVYLEGKTHEQAARAVGCPTGSVAWRLGQARENLRKRLARRGVGLSVGLALLLASLGVARAGDGTPADGAAGVPPPPPPEEGLSRLRPLALALGLLLFALSVAFAWSASARPAPPAGATGRPPADAVREPSPDAPSDPSRPRCKKSDR